MAREIRHFTVTIPVGGTAAAPQSFTLTTPPRRLVRLEIVVPPGPRGYVGFALAAAGTPIIPANSGAYIISDNEVIEWPIEESLDSGAWQLLAYNLGEYSHTLYFRFHMNLVQSGTGRQSGFLPLASLGG